MKLLKKIRLLCVMVILSATTFVAHAAELLKKDYPERYIIKKGDTLWDISAKYLHDPWRWKEIWQVNEYIKNPDLIYPDDVLILSFVNGKPVLRLLKRETVFLRPSVRVEDITKAIPPISPRALNPFFIKPLVTTKAEIESSAYIVEGSNNRLLGGKNVEMYARGLKETTERKYQIFRAGRVFLHPETGEELGLEALDIGTAKLVRPGDTARIKVLSSREEVQVLDRLRPDNSNGSLPFFFPDSHPDVTIKGYIFQSELSTPEFGRLNIVALTLGEREGVEPGQVFRVISAEKMKIDPITQKKYTIPSEQIGLVMVIRTFEKVSYAIITNSIRQISTADNVVHPKVDLLTINKPEAPEEKFAEKVEKK